MVGLFLAHLTATIFMTGVIWMVQVVHYPLFNRVGGDVFPAYEAAHTSLITLVVLPPMVIEAGTAALFLWQRPTVMPTWSVWVGLGLVVIIWAATFFLQVPQHTILGDGFDERAYQLLLSTNWIRTVAWNGRMLLVLWWLSRWLTM